MTGFGDYLEAESTSSRRNINLFANELRQRFQLPYVSLVNSGSSANLVAALALAEKLHAERRPLRAAISAFTFPTTISALIMAGFEIVAVDTDENKFNMSPVKLELLNPAPTLIALTHFLGFPCEMDKIKSYAHEHNCLILQDACETLGMTINGRAIAPLGDLMTLSFYHPHHLSSYGGGAVISNNADDFSVVDSIIHWGRACKCHINGAVCDVAPGPAHQFTYQRLGLNVEMSELNACFGRWKLLRFDEIEKARVENYQLLFEVLCPCKNIAVWPMPDIGVSPFVFPIRMTDGKTVDEAFSLLSQRGIESRTLMGGVCSEQRAFHDVLGSFSFPNAHQMVESTFFIGVHDTLPKEDVLHVAREIAALFQ